MEPPPLDLTTVLPQAHPPVEDICKDTNMSKTVSDKAGSIVTLKPYNFSSGSVGTAQKRKFDIDIKGGKKSKNFKKKGTVDYEIVPGLFVSTNYDKYLTIDMDPEADIFDIHKDIIESCGRTPKISQQSQGKLLIETISQEESNKLQSLSNLGGITVNCFPHPSLNQSKGMIYAPQLMRYSEERLQAEFETQGVSKVNRMQKKVNGVLTPQPNLILIFDSTKMPEFMYAAWFKYEVKPFIPRPRRCFYCQEFGHIITSCRSKSQGKEAICVNCGDHEHGECHLTPKCVHCGKEHPSSSNKCDVFLLEKEIQAIRVTERVTFAEARQKVLNKSIRPGESFANIVTKRTLFKRNRVSYNSDFDRRVIMKSKRTLSKESLNREPPSKIKPTKQKANRRDSFSSASCDTSYSSLPELETVITSDNQSFMETAPAFDGASASTEAASASGDAPASLEAAPLGEGALASVEAAPSRDGELASSEVESNVGGTTISLKVVPPTVEKLTSPEATTTLDSERNSYDKTTVIADPSTSTEMEKSAVDDSSGSWQKVGTKKKKESESTEVKISTYSKPQRAKTLQRNSGVQSSKTN